MLFHRQTLLLFALGLSITGCIFTKSTHTTEDEHQTHSALQLSQFVETIDQTKLCESVTLYITFTIDTNGVLKDPDFKTYSPRLENCTIDSVYIETLKEQFSNDSIQWKPIIEQGQKKEVRLSVPVRFH